jgi:hypothetical protein
MRLPDEPVLLAVGSFVFARYTIILTTRHVLCSEPNSEACTRKHGD